LRRGPTRLADGDTRQHQSGRNCGAGDYTPRTSKNDKFVQAVTEKNVQLTMQKLRDRSVLLRGMIDKGEIGLVGAMYDVSTGKVTFYE
jgi:carbonic anhydrase